MALRGRCYTLIVIGPCSSIPVRPTILCITQKSNKQFSFAFSSSAKLTAGNMGTGSLPSGVTQAVSNHSISCQHACTRSWPLLNSLCCLIVAQRVYIYTTSTACRFLFIPHSRNSLGHMMTFRLCAGSSLLYLGHGCQQ